jgi:phage anti-repressor protein
MSVDIVNLIESNPITKLSGNYQSKLVEKVKNTFSNYEQQLFLSSFYCYLKYDTKKDFVIDLDNVWQWLGFGQKVNAKRVLEKNFIIDKDYKFLLCQLAKQDEKSHGGHNKETFMLNIDTFKKFCLKSGTKKADEIHDYFIKLENIMFEITKEESEELKKQLTQIEDIKNKEIEEKLIKQKEKILLSEYAQSGSLVYIIKVKTLNNGEYIIKIGHSTKGIQSRYNEHKNKYDECLLLNCFSVDKSYEFEQFLFHHDNIRINKVTALIGHENKNELFLIGKELTYQILLKIINDNIHNYNYKVSELLLENDLLKNKLETNQNNINNDELTSLKLMVKQLLNKISSLEQSNQDILNKLNSQQTKVITGFNQQLPNLGPRLQKINPENFQLIKIYESVTELMNEDKNIKRPSIMKAIQENTIYCGFRWQLVERNIDPNTVHNIEPTKETKIVNIGYIAKLNPNKTEIVNVYLDRKTACKLNNYTSIIALDSCVKNFSIKDGYYYKLYNNCNEELRYAFENNYGIPLLFKNGVGQFDLEGNLIKEFLCKYDCIKRLSISDKTLAKCLENNIPYNGFFYKELGSKLSFFNPTTQ